METIVKRIWDIRGCVDKAILDHELIGLSLAMEEIDALIQDKEHIRTETTCSMRQYSKNNSAVNIVDKEENMQRIKSFLEKWRMSKYLIKNLPILYDESHCPLIQIWNLRASFDLLKFSIFEGLNIDDLFAQSQKIEVQLNTLLKNNQILNWYEREDLMIILRDVRELEKNALTRSSIMI